MRGSASAPAAAQHPVVAGLERWLAHVVGVFAAIAVVVEVAILLIGVFFRFGLNQPLVWSDELASIVFLAHPAGWRLGDGRFMCMDAVAAH